MSIQRVENHKTGTGLRDGIKSAAVGGVLGYASKYLLPVTKQEMDADYQGVIRVIRENAENSKQVFLDSIKNLPEKTLAQDAYISANKHFAKVEEKVFKLAFKNLRPTQPFVVAGAVTGLAYSFVKNVFFK